MSLVDKQKCGTWNPESAERNAGMLIAPVESGSYASKNAAGAAAPLSRT